MSIHKYDASNDELTRLAGGTLWADSPVGTILAYGGTVAPSGWFICDGTELVKTSYPELYAVIGDTFKGNKTPTTGYFCIPDLRECSVKGASDTNNDTYTIGTHQKIALGEFIDDRVQTHTHTFRKGSSQSAGGTIAGIQQANFSSGTVFSPENNNGRSGATTEVKAVGVNYIIKAKMVAMPSDFMSKVDEAVKEYVIYEKYTATVSGGYFRIPKREGYQLASVAAEYGNMAPTQIVGIQSTQDSYYNIYVRSSNDTTALISGTNNYHLIWFKNV